MGDRFCRYCGAAHTLQGNPQACLACKKITFHNPLPVAVLLQPIIWPAPMESRVGLLVGRRQGSDKAGEWALPGGFMELSDASVEDAAFRELKEETGLGQPLLPCYPEIVSSMCDGRHVLVFVQNTAPIHESWVANVFVASAECSEVRVARQPETLAFPSHTEAMAAWFERTEA